MTSESVGITPERTNRARLERAGLFGRFQPPDLCSVCPHCVSVLALPRAEFPAAARVFDSAIGVLTDLALCPGDEVNPGKRDE